MSREVVSSKSRKEKEEIARHNLSSPFLRLPQEFKDIIYEKVTGDRVLIICNPFRRVGDWLYRVRDNYLLPWEISECWNRFVQKIKAHEDTNDTFAAYKQHKTGITLEISRVCRQMNGELENTTYKNYILEITSDRLLEFHFLTLASIGRPPICFFRFLGISAEPKDRRSMVILADAFSLVPKKFISLRAIVLEYRFEGTEERAKEIMPYKTPQQIEEGMKNNVRKSCHERILQTVIKLLQMPLIRADFSFGGGRWPKEQVKVWEDYVADKLGKGDAQERKWREYVDSLSEGAGRVESREIVDEDHTEDDNEKNNKQGDGD